MRTLTAYFLGGFKSEECYNLHHETDLGCNEVWNFACRIFDDPEALLEHSVSLAKHLYESGMHPQIKGGEFYTAYFSDCNFGGERCDALGCSSPRRATRSSTSNSRPEGCTSRPAKASTSNGLDKGAVIFNTEREEGFAVFVVDNTNRTEARYWIDDFLRVRQRQDNYHNTHNTLAMCK
ncbi:MAG: nucleoid-associated protein, partial [Alistipes shahii]